MNSGDLVTFIKSTTINTPGAPAPGNKPGVGVVVGDVVHESSFFSMAGWVNVLWPAGTITRCYKKDLKLLNKEMV